MKERPILFSGAMVRAILEGRKTQTRRIGKIQSPSYTGLGVGSAMHKTKGLVLQATYDAYPGRGTARWAICECPHGVPGDRLWVRETWRTCRSCDSFRPSEIQEHEQIRFEADDHETGRPFMGWGKVRQSIFMPRELSRIALEIVSVRVERLQEISEEDAIAEGVCGYRDGSDLDAYWVTARKAYRALWESINGPVSWGANPWVWVVEFKRL